MPNSSPTSPRAGLTEPCAIIAGMAEDLNDLRREQGSVTQPSLMARGWSAGQLRKHYLAALDEAARTYSDTRAPVAEYPVITGIDFACGPDRTVAYDPASAQAIPFESFDATMRRQLANFEEFQGCNFGAPSSPALEGDA